MDQKGLLLEIFHADCDITIVPCQEMNTQDPGHKAIKAFINVHNHYLTETTVVVIDNVKEVDSLVEIDGLITSLADHIKKVQTLLFRD